MLTVYHQDIRDPCQRLLINMSHKVRGEIVQGSFTKAININQSSHRERTLDNLLERNRRATAVAERAIIAEHT